MLLMLHFRLLMFLCLLMRWLVPNMRLFPLGFMMHLLSLRMTVIFMVIFMFR